MFFHKDNILNFEKKMHSRISLKNGMLTKMKSLENAEPKGKTTRSLRRLKEKRNHSTVKKGKYGSRNSDESVMDLNETYTTTKGNQVAPKS